MTWNWQQSDWPNFRWDAAKIAVLEEKFLLSAGVSLGAAKHLSEGERSQLLVEAMSG